MAGYVTSERIAEAIATGGGRTAAHTYATVTEVLDSWTLKARLDGATEPVTVAAFCAAAVGDRIAVTIRPDGRCVALGRRGGESWETFSGKPASFPPEAHDHAEFGSAHIEASGTSGMWRYIKFSDGLVIMYGVATFSTGTWNAWGGMYEASRTWQGSFPFPLMETGFEIANITLDSLQTCSTSPNSTQNLSTTKTNIYRPMRATTAGSCTARINVLVVGRWK